MTDRSSATGGSHTGRSTARSGLGSIARALRPYLILLLPGMITFIPGCAETFLLHPSTRTMGGDVMMFTPEGASSALQYARIGSAGGADAPELVAYIGNASRAEHASQRWARMLKGLVGVVYSLNYPGFGASEGVADLDSLLPSGEALDRLQDPQILAGNSMGAAVALAVAARRDNPPDLLIIQSVPPLDDLILKRHGWWNLWLLAIPIAIQVPNELDAIENAKRCTGPAIFLSAYDDNTVPPCYQQDVIDAYGGPKVVIRYDGGHNARMPDDVVEELRQAVDQQFAR